MLLSQILKRLTLVAISVTQATNLWAHSKTIAVLPFHFKHSEPEPKKVVEDTTQEIFEKAGLTLHSSDDTLKSWLKDLKFKKPRSVPQTKNLIKLGQKLKVDYICAGVVTWKISTPWVLLGPKTKAVCNVHYKVIDIAKKEVVLNIKKQADSTKKESGLEIAGDVLLTPLATMVSGGPKVPHMKRSGQIATLEAFSPFVKKIKTGSCCAHTTKTTEKTQVQQTLSPKKVEKTLHKKVTTHTENH